MKPISFWTRVLALLIVNLLATIMTIYALIVTFGWITCVLLMIGGMLASSLFLGAFNKEQT